MATHDYIIDNQASATARADINSVLQAILTNNSSSTAPTTTAGNMLWYDTSNNELRMRSEADDAWITIAYLDQTNDWMEVRSNVIQAASSAGIDVKNSSGTKIIDLQVASQVTAEAASNNTELMTPLRVKQSIDENAVTVVASDFVGTNGYVKYNNGLVIQWGRNYLPSSGGTISWPVSFPSACFTAIGNDSTNTNAGSNMVGTISTTGWTGDVGSSATYNWIAIGN